MGTCLGRFRNWLCVKDTGAAYHSDCRKDIKSLHELCVQVSHEQKQKYSLWLDLKIHSAENKNQLRVQFRNFYRGRHSRYIYHSLDPGTQQAVGTHHLQAVLIHPCTYNKSVILEIACLPVLFSCIVIDFCSLGMTVAFRELPLKVGHSCIQALYPCLCLILSNQ